MKSEADEVDVGHQDLDAHRPALAQVHRQLVLVVLHARKQAGHVLDRMVGLQPGGPVGDQAVAEGMALAERVVGERLDHVEQLRSRTRRRNPSARNQQRTFPAPSA